MRTARLWPGVVLTVAVMGGGCDEPASDEVTLQRFGAHAAGSICSKVYECCGANDVELGRHMNYSGGLGACGNKTGDSMGLWASVIDQEQAKGRLSYDGRRARRCMDAFAAASCEAHKRNEPLDGCDSFITPRTPAGMPCAASEWCIDGTCAGLSGDTEGRCQAFVDEGQSCAANPCARSLTCDGSKICRRRKASGESCRSHGECASQGCNGHDPDAGTAGTCGLKGGEQTRCFVTTGCAFGESPAGAAGLPLLGILALAAARLSLRRRRPRS